MLLIAFEESLNFEYGFTLTIDTGLFTAFSIFIIPPIFNYVDPFDALSAAQYMSVSLCSDHHR